MEWLVCMPVAPVCVLCVQRYSVNLRILFYKTPDFSLNFGKPPWAFIVRSPREAVWLGGRVLHAAAALLLS